MNLKEVNKWLDDEFGCSYTKLEELHDFYFEKYTDLQQENQRLKEMKYKTLIELQEKIDNAIERLEALIVFWKKYNPIDNAMQIGQFEGVIEILKEGKDVKD